MTQVTTAGKYPVLTLKCWGECSKRATGAVVHGASGPKARAGRRTAQKRIERGREGGTALVSRALKNQGLWLTLTYVGLMLLLVRAYA